MTYAQTHTQDSDARWWREDEDDAHSAVCNVFRTIQSRQAGRAQSLLQAARMFGGAKQLGLSPGSFGQAGTGYGGLSLNIIKAITLTARADLVQGPPPEPWFLTSGGDWYEQRAAQGMTEYVVGVLDANRFAATDRRMSLHSAVFGDGIVKGHVEHGRVKIELVFPWEVWVDDRDAHYGTPRSMFQVKHYDRSVLAEKYPDSKREIEEASRAGGSNALMITPTMPGDALADQIPVIEAWHLPSGPDAKDGRRVVCIENATLADEGYEDEDFPFVKLPWTDPLAGYWSEGVATELREIQIEINMTIEKIRRALALCAVPRVFVDRASKIATAQLNNEEGAIVTYTGRPPVFAVAQSVSPELVQQLDRLWSRAFQLTGVSELAASAMKPAGLDSGESIRVYAQESSKRFTTWTQARHDVYREIASLVVRLTDKLAKDAPDGATVTYVDTKRKRSKPVKWADVMLDPAKYSIRCFAVSSLPRDPAGRIATIQQYAAAGWIDARKARRLIGVPDLEADTSLEDAPYDLIEEACERMLGDGEYVAPEPFDDLALALKVVALRYAQARLRKAPEERLELLRRYLTAAQGLMTPPPPPPAPPGAEAMPPDDPNTMPPDAAPVDPAAMAAAA